MKILITIFRGCLSAVKAPVPIEVTILDRDNLSEPCSVSTFSPIQASDAEINKLIQHALDEIDVNAKAREEEEKAQKAKRIAELWDNDSTQFVRLLSKLKGMGLSPAQMHDLVASMDMTKEEIHQLLDRAEEAHSVTIKELERGPPDVDGG